ncbi:MAG: reverse transcriptase N-terminal domain-containing protein, partial [Anaerolineae bacterium]
EDWETLRWKEYQRNVYRLQRRIYRATRQGDWRRVHKLQRLLLRSWSARCLAVRRVSQENRGKRTAGVDGVKNLYRTWPPGGATTESRSEQKGKPRISRMTRIDGEKKQ